MNWMILILAFSAPAFPEGLMESEAALRACGVDEDCVLVRSYICGTAEAVHRGMEGSWKKFSQAERKAIQGKPKCEKKKHLPQNERYSVHCHSGRCEAVAHFVKPGG